VILDTGNGGGNSFFSGWFAANPPLVFYEIILAVMTPNDVQLNHSQRCNRKESKGLNRAIMIHPLPVVVVAALSASPCLLYFTTCF
jgi:hypothetical protein